MRPDDYQNAKEDARLVVIDHLGIERRALARDITMLTQNWVDKVRDRILDSILEFIKGKADNIKFTELDKFIRDILDEEE